MSYYQLLFPIYQWAAKRMCLDCQPFIKKGSKILDLGCGSAIVAKNFQDFFQAEVIGVDIRDRRIFKIPFQIIDGFHLPFPEKYFDLVLISYVLHHSGDPIAILKEAKRVSKKIIIYEDLPEDILSKIYCQLHGLTFNKLFQENNNVSFRAAKEWEEIFQKIGLTIIFKKRINNFPIKKELYILGA